MTRALLATLALLSSAGVAAADPAGPPNDVVSVAQAGAAAAPSPDTLDMLLAPVALYPDQLLAQILLAAASPAKVTEFDQWLKRNEAVKGSALQDAAKQQGFEPSLVALALFPQVIGFMAGDIGWTTEIGQAFSKDRGAVFASIQRLRAQSKAVGTLKSTPQQEVQTRTTEGGQEVIVIEPANPQVVYVPQYNSQTVYTQPAQTTVVVQDDDDDGAAVAAGVIGFAAGVAIGAAIDNNYYYGPYGWHGGAYMYNDAWDDWYDDREDAREDWYENREDAREDYQERREDVAGERTERGETRQQQSTERTGASQQQRTERTESRQGAGASSYEARGYSGERDRPSQTTAARSGTRSDAFSGYSSGRSERAASSRGQKSRSSSRGSRGGGGRRR